MFSLKLKGFNPVKSMEVSTPDSLVCFTGDETLGMEVLRDTLVSIQKVLSEEYTNQFYDHEYVWRIKLGSTLNIEWEFNKQKYIAELRRKTKRYSFNLEEGYKGKNRLFVRKGTTFDETERLVKDDQTSWLLKTESVKQLQSLKAIKDANCCPWVSSFTWYEMPPVSMYKPLSVWLMKVLYHDRVLDFINRYLPEILPSVKEMEAHDDENCQGYTYVRFKLKDSEEYPTRYSSKVWNVAGLLAFVALGENIFWKPDNLLNPDELKTFLSLLKDKPYPNFVFLNNPVEGETLYKVSGDQKKITIK